VRVCWPRGSPRPSSATRRSPRRPRERGFDGRLGRQVRDFDQRLAAARERLQRVLKDAEGLEQPDLEALARAHAAADEAHTEAVKEEERLDGALKSSRALSDQLREVERTLAEIENRHRIVGRISAIADGRNAQASPSTASCWPACSMLCLARPRAGCAS